MTAGNGQNHALSNEQAEYLAMEMAVLGTNLAQRCNAHAASTEELQDLLGAAILVAHNLPSNVKNEFLSIAHELLDSASAATCSSKLVMPKN